MSNYLSVSEYAKIHGKDPGNIRRLLSSGRLKGQKVGKQWVIEADTAYPNDKRETTGQYRNWRKRIALNRNKELIKTISEMVKSFKSIYGDLLSEIVIYGSYARGTQTEESDVDIALILSEKPLTSVTNAMIDCVASYELEFGKVFSVIEIDLMMYEKWKDIMPFYKNVRKEGIVLWRAAA